MSTDTHAFIPISTAMQPFHWRSTSAADSTLIACMGGWCDKREACAHYWAPVSQWRRPVERLCAVVRVFTDSQTAQDG